MKAPWLRSFLYYVKCFPCLDQPGEQDEITEKTPAINIRKPRGWKCIPYIIGNEAFEKVASLGLTANFTVYLVKHFRMEQVAAANLTNVFSGTTNFAPVVGAFISDAYAGRFRTISYTCFASLLGMLVMTLTAALPQLQSPSCSPDTELAKQCARPSFEQIAVLITALVLLMVGAAGVRPYSLPFGVDQFDKFSERDRRGLNSFFNWYYCTSTVGTVIAITVVVYIQDNIGWTIGFGICTGLMVLSIVVFFLGTKFYVYVPPEGSVFTGVAQVLVAAIRKRSLRLPAPDNVLEQERMLYNPYDRSARILRLPLTLQFRCLNRAAIPRAGEVREDGSPANKWRLCSVQQVEEVKCLLRIIPIWASAIICFVALGQQWTFAILQALTMDRHIGPHFQIPPGTIGVVSLIALSLFIPIYDKLLVPIARRFTGIESGITVLQRQGVGLFLSAMSMVVAGLVEAKRRESALAHGGMSPHSALWLTPQLALLGVVEAFSAVGQIEFYNREFPEHLQTMAGSLSYCAFGASGYLSTALVSIIQKKTNWLDNDINLGRLEYYYYVIAAMAVVNLVYFVVCAHFYRYKGTPEVLLR